MGESLSPKEIRDRIKNSIKLGLSTQEIEELAAMLRKHKSSANVFSKEINAMMKKSGRDRYIYSVKRIADQEIAWSLKNGDGTVRTVDEEGNDYFYIWPFKEYALRCAVGEWAGFGLHRISLDDLLNVILPNLSADGTQVAVFKSLNDPSITSVSADDFLNNILHERSQFR
ncbi:MAG: DUF2750 domain-containing protein [Defluviitaleaceae bacterium]|nr:DUF2750 domain-containing protein [Defluviitaleaceae bacterium]MCL2263623.1 DUF2750 domain-containing protein [Defluviitaleaceae bacterium]